jgi:RNA polymerase sigma factor (sigma-70 family)
LSAVTAPDLQRTIEAVWRLESARLIASLARLVRNVGLAEDLAQDALVAALTRWPESGIPDNPGAWLMATAKRRGLDQLRRNKMLARNHCILEYEGELGTVDAADTARAALDDEIGDDLLRLVFTACHPVLPPETRVAFTLRMLGGLTTAEVARAFLVPEATIAQRIVRAKQTLRKARIPFEAPQGAERDARVATVLEVIYSIFNEGYSASEGEDWTRPALCEDALRLGRLLAGIAPDEVEVHGLLALMELQSSRLKARNASDGQAILLFDQDRTRWDPLLIRRGLAALDRTRKCGTRSGPYTLQAEISACHARAMTPEETDWAQIVSYYNKLLELQPTPVIALNRAVAISMASGPALGLALVDELFGAPSLRHYHLLPSVRAELLRKLGRTAEARTELERAAALTSNQRERELLRKRAIAIGSQDRQSAPQ